MSTRGTAVEPMPVAQAAVLAEFARATKGAARTVSLYPPSHPAIRSALARVTAAAARLTAEGDATLLVQPDTIAVDGRAPARPDPAIADLAAMLHARLVGELTIGRAADDEAWLALLRLLAQAAEDLIAAGGIGRAWIAAGHGHFLVHEIDYAEVLRERAGGDPAAWDRIVAFYLHGERTALDDRALASLLQALGDPAQFGSLLERLRDAEAPGGAAVGARAAALVHLLRTAVEAARQRGPGAEAQAVETIAASAARLTPDMMLALLGERASADEGQAAIASAIVARISDDGIASFVARSVELERGATGRLAHAFQALVPDAERRDPLIARAEAEVRASELGRDANFDELWHGAAEMLRSYSDEQYVSESYGRELSAARTQALEVERVADDPPERVQDWLGTIAPAEMQQLDLQLLLDLLRIEDEPRPWSDVAAMVTAEIERRTLLADVAGARQLADALLRDRGADGRPALATAAATAAERLGAGPLPRHVVLQLRNTDDAGVAPLAALCHAIGPSMVRPLAETLATEEDSRAIRALREILLGFGAAGRQSVEQLKSSSNPAVRRTAIDLLRVFGGREALPELASMLGDADPQVQRESIRAIVQIATPEAYAVLERALVASRAARDTIVEQLLGLRDDKAIPLLCYVLDHTRPRGRLAQAHIEIIEALGGLSAHPESTRTLRAILHGGDWWAPFRTRALREAAAAALLRIGSPDTRAVLDEAAADGSRAVRKVARPKAELAARRGRERA